ncbi:GL18148 [Drosophila persimilis]|uniref:GL18148 n=2 Tax=Drosophila persimilis TaxID=7234 RepID=B4H870_DROPE|nr:GL18148 [Drosophila persimilis]
MLRNYGHNPLNPVIKPKQELDQQPPRLDENRQQQTEQAYTGDFYDAGDAPGSGTDASASVTCTSSVGADQLQSNQQTQQQTSGGLQQPQPQPHRQTQSPGPGTVMLNKPLSQGQQSPQHSITPSGGSSTPEIKFNNDKMANEIQLQLSRSSSAAAISERTLEECWSTLQRLFMHKSAMQQIQQQIPRVGLATHGVTGTPSLGGNATPGTDTKPHQCQQCMKSFSSNHQLVQHIRVHTGEKPYKCSYCDRRFKQLSHVQQHTRLHTGERPYKCHLPDCGRAFIQLSNLQQHLRNHDAQVERAKNRPFHCNICGKGFATESSLRTHTSKELQLHLGVLQQHAALIGGPNATSCPVCHKLFLGTEALMDHMKHVHEEKSPPSSGTAATHFSEIINCAGGNGNDNVSGGGPIPIGSQCTSESTCARIPTHPPTGSGPNLSDSYLGKRRTANHPCPVCGKHYVNEGSLRKHLACHAETSQLPNSLRMWPCSVCQAVFTHENGLLTHMESMRMDPKHQFAAQYVLSRAAAEQRERESILAATIAAGSGAASGIGVGEARNVLPMGVTNSGGSNSKCPSPSANSECSSNGRLSSSSTSDQDQEHDHDHGLSETENSSHNNISNTNNNTLCANNNSCNSSKMNELRLPNSSQYNMDTGLHVANRMSLMAAAAAAVAASRPPQDGIDCSNVPSAAVQAAVVNLAAAMRMNNPNNGSTALVSHSAHPHSIQHQQHLGEHPLPHHQHPHNLQQQQTPQHHQQQLSHLLGHGHSHGNNSRRSPNINVPSLQMQNESSANASSVAMNMNVNMMRGSIEPDSTLGGMNPIEALHHQQQHHHQASTYSQHAVAPSTQQAHSQHSHHHPETALRMHQQAEAILRSHEVAFRLAASTGVKSESEQQQSIGGNGNVSANSNEQHRFPTHQQEQQVPSSS